MFLRHHTWQRLVLSSAAALASGLLLAGLLAPGLSSADTAGGGVVFTLCQSFGLSALEGNVQSQGSIVHLYASNPAPDQCPVTHSVFTLKGPYQYDATLVGFTYPERGKIYDGPSLAMAWNTTGLPSGNYVISGSAGTDSGPSYMALFDDLQVTLVAPPGGISGGSAAAGRGSTSPRPCNPCRLQ